MHFQCVKPRFGCFTGEMKSNRPGVQEAVVSLVRQADYPHPSKTDAIMLHAKAASFGDTSVKRQRWFSALHFHFGFTLLETKV